MIGRRMAVKNLKLRAPDRNENDMTEGPLIYLFDQMRVEPEAHRVFRAGRPIELEPKAFALLLQFIEHPQELLDRNRLLDAVWGHHHVAPATLNRIIALLRRALGDDVANPRYIQTVHGLGYRFALTPPPATQSPRPAPWERGGVPGAPPCARGPGRWQGGGG